MKTALVADKHLPTPVDGLDGYLQAVGAIPLLSAAEETALAVRLRRHDDLDAARQLVLAHLRFVIYVARGYTGYGLPLGDLIQEGNVGLMKAVRRFDPAHGVRLVSFAVHWIRAEIHEFILRNWRIVKVATTKSQRKLFFNLRGLKEHLGRLQRGEAEGVAQQLGVTADEVLEMETRLGGHDVTFESDAEGEGPAAYLQDAGADPAELLEQADWQAQSGHRLTQALDRLDPRSRDIVSRRWLGEDKPTLHELAAHHGVSAERIRQLENNAIRKLRVLLPAV